MDPVEITLDPMTEGDSWDGIPVIGPIVFRHYDPEDEAAGEDGYVIDDPPGPLVAARLTFARKDEAVNVLVCSSDVTAPAPSGQHPITITDAETWALVVPPMDYADFPMTAGTWEADFEFFWGTGHKKTYYRITQVIKPRR